MKASLEHRSPSDVAQVDGKVYVKVVDADVGEEACDGWHELGDSTSISDQEKKYTTTTKSK
jgi:hypothetical protein